MKTIVFKFDLTNIALLLIIALLLLGGLGYFTGLKTEYKAALLTSNNYKNALFAKMKVYKDTNGIIRAERVTLQETLVKLRADSTLLSTEKKDLLKRIAATGHEKSIIGAALIQTKVKAKNIYVTKPSVDTDSFITFVSNSDSISFKATVSNVHPIPSRTPVFHLDSVTLANKTLIDFKWGPKKEGYPVSFSITNSNPLFKTVNIESYVIPEIQKNVLRPTFLSKLGTGIRVHGIVFSVGVVVGFGAATYIFIK